MIPFGAIASVSGRVVDLNGRTSRRDDAHPTYASVPILANALVARECLVLGTLRDYHTDLVLVSIVARSTHALPVNILLIWLALEVGNTGPSADLEKSSITLAGSAVPDLVGQGAICNTSALNGPIEPIHASTVPKRSCGALIWRADGGLAICALPIAVSSVARNADTLAAVVEVGVACTDVPARSAHSDEPRPAHTLIATQNFSWGAPSSDFTDDQLLILNGLLVEV